jgi:hypothetical protein
MADNTFDDTFASIMNDPINEAGLKDTIMSTGLEDTIMSDDPINEAGLEDTIMLDNQRHIATSSYNLESKQPEEAQQQPIEQDDLGVLLCLDICDTYHDFFINKENVLLLTDWLDYNYNKLSDELKSSEKLRQVVDYIKTHTPDVDTVEFKKFITDQLFTDNPSNFIKNNNKLLIANVSEIHTRQIVNSLLFHGAIDYHYKKKQSPLIKSPDNDKYVINTEKFDSDNSRPKDYSKLIDPNLSGKQISTLLKYPILQNNEITMFGQNSKFDPTNKYPLICEFNVEGFNFKVKCTGKNNTVKNMFALALLFSGKYITIEILEPIGRRNIVGIDKIDFTNKKALMQKLLEGIEITNNTLLISIKNDTKNIDQLPTTRNMGSRIHFYDSEQAYLDSPDYKKCSKLGAECKLIQNRESNGEEIIQIEISSDNISELESKDEAFFKIVFLKLITCFFSIKRTGDRIPILCSYLNPQYVLNNQDTYARIYNYFLIKACDEKDDVNKRSVLLNASVDKKKKQYYWNDKYIKYKKKYLELKKKISENNIY